MTEANIGRPLRILLVNKFWRPLGGVEEHCFEVKRAFEARGHEVIPFAMADEDNIPSPAEAYFPSKVEFRGGPPRERLRAAGRAVFGVETVRRLARLLDEQPIDVAHVVHAYHQLGMTFLRQLRKRRIPTVLSLHDYKAGCPSYRLFSDATGEICTICLDKPSGYLWAPMATRCWDGSRSGGLMLSAEAVVTHAVGAYSKGPSAVIVLNDLQRGAVRAAGVPEHRVHLVPHAVSVDAAPPASRGAHALYVGRLVVEKGVEDAVDACAAAGLPLRVIGEGRLRPDLERRARERGADVVFTGLIPQGEVLAEMRAARLLLVPSRWHEVLALVITQAIAAHLPVVATDVGGNPDLLGDGRGFLYRPGDVHGLAGVLGELMQEPALANDRAARAAAWARTELTAEKWAERMQAVYATAGVEL